eukprot:gene7499-8330_t
MMKSCAKQGPTFKPLSTKETLFFLLRKLQDKESQVSAMRIMIEERDEKITNHENYIGALLEKMRNLEFGDKSKKKVSRSTQTKLDASAKKRQSWYDAKKTTSTIQSGFSNASEVVNPYATLPRKKAIKRNKTEIQRGRMNEGVVFKSEKSLISEEGSVSELNTSRLNSLTVRLLRSELARVWKDLRDLEHRIIDNVSMKERRIKNAANEIDTGRQKIISAQLREKNRELQNGGDAIQENDIERLEDNMKLLHLEVKYKASEVFAIEENIREMHEICKLLENSTRNVQETLEIDPEIFEGNAVFR